MNQLSHPPHDLLGTPPDELSPELALVLEQYLVELEQGRSPDVDALLRAHPDQAESLRAYLASIDFLYQAGGQHESVRPARTASPMRQLGDYRIIREIGRGGMGVVYEAEQISLGRQVALKVLPFAAVLDQRQLNRFKNEAQAAAQLHHANIVPVYSVGCERGVHFYAMQYIQGQSLEEMIRELRQQRHGDELPSDRTNLPSTLAGAPRAVVGSMLAERNSADFAPVAESTQRQFLHSATRRSSGSREHFERVARLGVQAADALEHAHAMGVVHRDIKPSNLLLDETAKLWIADFGLARFQSDAGLTVSGELVGTVRYMSPEQLRCKPGLVDQRTDIYSLGATLYELATLRAAFPSENPQELMRQIESSEPAAPRRIDRSIPRDLETIILKAMSKLRDDRYSTASELADDLRRFLEGKPALARRPTRLERACRWAQRHTGLVAASTAMAVLLLGGLSLGMLLVSHQKHRTELALTDARDNYDRAEANLLQAREVVDRFCTRAAGQLVDAPGLAPLRRELLTDALGYYRSFIDQAEGDADVQAELARAYFRVGEISEQLSDDDAAAEAYRTSRALFARLAAESDEPAVEADLALCDNNLGLLSARRGDLQAGEAAYRKAIARQQRLVLGHGKLSRVRGELATSCNNLGLLMSQTDRAAEAAEWYAKALTLQHARVDEQPQLLQPRSDLAATYNNLGYLHSASDAVQAQEAYQAAVAIQRQLAADFPQSPQLKSDLALTLNNLGALESRNGDSEAAERAYEDAARLQGELVQAAPLTVAYRRDLAVTHNNLGFLHHRQQRLDEAMAAFDQARTILEELVSDHPQSARFRSSLGGVQNNLGMVHEARQQFGEAIAAYRKAVEQQQAALQAQPQSEQFRQFLSMHYFNLGRALRTDNQWPAAREAALERKQLWPHDASQLYHVACELALAAHGLEGAERQACLDAAWQSIQQAREAGFDDLAQLQTADELDLLRKQPHIAEQLSQWRQNE